MTANSLALGSGSVVVLTIVIIAVCGAIGPDEPHRRFEYKLSFKGPHLVQRDGSIPFWTHGGREYYSFLPPSDRLNRLSSVTIWFFSMQHVCLCAKLQLSKQIQ